MSREYRSEPASRAHAVRRLFMVGATALLVLVASVSLLTLAMPRRVQADPASPAAPPVYMVDKSAEGEQTGESWTDAFISIQDALDVAVGAEIWVAKGVYYPDEGRTQTNGDRSSTFELKQGVTIYGGFNGTETVLEQRNWEINVTVLSGDLDKNDNVDADGVVAGPEDIVGTDNAYHVVTAEEVMSSAKLDGFVITGGLADSTIEAADLKGAGIYVNAAGPDLANLIIQGNKASGIILIDPVGFGGGMHVSAGVPQFSNVVLRNNYARTSGGGLYVENSGGGIANLTFEDNVAGASGGGLYVENSGGVIANLTFEDNVAGASGGGMCVITSLGHSMSNLTFTGNHATEEGGGLYVQSGVEQSSLANSSFAGNTAASGGGLCVDQSIFSLRSSSLVANEASEHGGGMVARLSTYFLTDVTFNGNHASSAGGGVYADRNVGTVTDSTFLNNTSILGAGMYVDDGENDDAVLVMDSPLFAGNVASEAGGGLYVVDSPEGTLEGVTFINNGATSGNGGGMVLSSSEGYELSGTDFDVNAAVAGGGLYADSSDATLTEVRFRENEATQDGGGMLSSGAGSDLELVNVAFAGNDAGGSGGGLSTASQNITIVNAAFSGNVAGGDGGGLDTTSSNIAVINSTFSGNNAGGSGGGVSTTSPNMAIDNTVIWNNADTSGTGTADASITGTVDEIEYSLIQGQNPTGTGNLDGTNPDNDPEFVIPIDPSTAPTVSGKLSVKYGSPIVDVGNNEEVPPGVTVDLAGNTRIYNSVVDLGAYELQLACPAAPTARLYVDRTASLGNTGTSWEVALKNLRDAFTLAADPDCEGIVEIWVAEGVYRPDEGEGIVPDSRTETYQLIDGMAVYGGFDGGELLLEERDWVNNVTVLSGDVDNNDISSGGIVLNPGNIRGANSHHVVIASGTGNTTILDGFTINAGQADDSTVDQADRGAGLYNNAGSPTLANLSFVGNTAGDGAGLANINGSNPSITSVQFQSNGAETHGGALYNVDSSPTLSDTLLIENTAYAGAAIYNLTSSPTLTNTVLSANTASEGAALFNNASNPSLINALFSGNSADTGAAIYNSASNPTLVNITVSGNRASSTAGGMFNTNTSLPVVDNSIFWNNQDSTGTGTASATIDNDDLGSVPLINYCLVQDLGGIDYTGDDNFDQNPWFTAPEDPSAAPGTGGDYTLSLFSPAIDVGNNAANSTVTDLAGNDRIINSIIDLGAYEAPYRIVYSVYLPTILSNYP